MRKALQTEKGRWVLAFLLAFVSMLSISRYKWVGGNRVFALLLLVGFTVWFKQLLPLQKGRTLWVALVGGGLYALMMSIAEVVEARAAMRDVLGLLPGYFVLFSAACLTLFMLLEKRSDSPKIAKNSGKVSALFAKLLGGGRRQNLLLFGIVALCWLPYFILFYPGVVTHDTASQMAMGLGYSTMNTHHPPLHSLWLGGCMQLGKAVFGNYAAGVALASASQLLLCAVAAVCALSCLRRLNAAFGLRLGVLAAYALAPCYGWYSITLWKDVWLGVFCTLFLLLLAEVWQRRAAFFSSPLRVAALVLCGLMAMFSKNNGVYIFLIGVVVMVAAAKGCRRQLGAVLLAGLCVYYVVDGPVFDALGYNRGSSAEALSIPLLQIALVARVDSQAISKEDWALLDEVLPMDEVGEAYNSEVSDSVKDHFNAKAFAEKPMEYASAWLRIGLARPGLYARAFLEHINYYFYPDSVQGIWGMTPYTRYIRENDVDFGGLETMKGKYAEPMAGAMDFLWVNIGHERNVPGLSMLFSVGFHFWVLVFCSLWLVLKKNWGKLAPLALLYAVWLTCLASPVNGSFRYAFPICMALPFVVGWAFSNGKLKMDNEK